jgi:P27 family predicted phage terminase small subunit
MPRLIRPLKPSDPVAEIQATPPRGLKTAGRRLWSQVAPLPWVGGSDAMTLRCLCELADLAESLRADVRAQGASYVCRGRVYSHPSLGALLDVERQLTSGMASFGLTPASRGKLGVAEPPAVPSKMEQFSERRAARMAGGRPSTPPSPRSTQNPA